MHALSRLSFLQILGSAITTFNVGATDDLSQMWCRYVDDAPAPRLELAIRQLSRGDIVLDLISVLHFGDREAYEGLNARIDGYDMLLYEWAGRPAPPRAPTFSLDENETTDTVTKRSPSEVFCDLDSQYRVLDLTKPNCLWADISEAELDRRMNARREVIPELLRDHGTLSVFLDTVDSSRSWDLLRRKDGQILFKRSLAQFIASRDDADCTIHNHPVMNQLRTDRALQVLRLTIDPAKDGVTPVRKVGLLYGAGHMPDMWRQLVSEGWHPLQTEWYTLWDLRTREGDTNNRTEE